MQIEQFSCEIRLASEDLWTELQDGANSCENASVNFFYSISIDGKFDNLLCRRYIFDDSIVIFRERDYYYPRL